MRSASPGTARENADEVIRYGLRSMNDYVGDIRSRGALRKLIRSRRRIAPALRFLAKRTLRNMLAEVPIGIRSRLLSRSMAARVARFFETLAAHGTRVSLVFSETDPGLGELCHYYGPAGRDLRDPNVTVSIIPGSDHNLTTREASDWLLDHMIAFAAFAREDEMATPRPARAGQHAVCQT